MAPRFSGVRHCISGAHRQPRRLACPVDLGNGRAVSVTSIRPADNTGSSASRPVLYLPAESAGAVRSSPTYAGCGRKCSRPSSGIDGPPRYCWNRPPSRNCPAAPCTFGCRRPASRARWRSRATPRSSRPRCARSWAWNGSFGATPGPSAAGRRQPAPAVRPNPISTRPVKPVGLGRPRSRRRPASHRTHPHAPRFAVGARSAGAVASRDDGRYSIRTTTSPTTMRTPAPAPRLGR